MLGTTSQSKLLVMMLSPWPCGSRTLCSKVWGGWEQWAHGDTPCQWNTLLRPQQTLVCHHPAGLWQQRVTVKRGGRRTKGNTGYISILTVVFIGTHKSHSVLMGIFRGLIWKPCDLIALLREAFSVLPDYSSVFSVGRKLPLEELAHHKRCWDSCPLLCLLGSFVVTVAGLGEIGTL